MRSAVRTSRLRPGASLLAAFLLLLAALPARAQERSPDGGYLLVDTVLPGIEQGLIVPIFTHVALAGDEMRFTFLTYYYPSAFDCEKVGKCHQAVQALTLRFEERDGLIHVVSQEILDAPGATIDRRDMDRPQIITPMLAFVDGAEVRWSAEGFTIIRRGRRGSIEGRFVAASRDFAEDAVAFGGIYELPLREVGDCILQQLTAINLRAERSPAEEVVLATARISGRLHRLRGESGYYAYGDTPDPRDPEEVLQLRDRAWILNFAMAPMMAPEELAEQLDIPSASREGFAEARAAEIDGRETEIIAARRYLARVAETLRPLPSEEQAARVCQSILFDG